MKAMLHELRQAPRGMDCNRFTHRFLPLRTLTGFPFPMIHRVQP
jgi:hypothetical protein